MDLLTLLRQLAGELGVRHMLPSVVISADDDPGKPSRELIELALRAASRAADIQLPHLSQRLSAPPYWPDIWPGEHYRLLTALMQVTRPRLVIEIGTATGLSALAIKDGLPESSSIVTFDIVPWRDYPDYVLRPEDFADNRLQQIVADLTNRNLAKQYAALLAEADLLFVDAAKDGSMEATILDNFSAIGLKEGALLMFDDIRMIPMFPIWRRIALPKLDLTSFGHWSGTGLVRWSQRIPWCGVTPSAGATVQA
ncbi:MAG: methyltransferase [Verrucomicrobia bacterium]|nr:methyltransferase [Verrucomicrobiota bacterium]